MTTEANIRDAIEDLKAEPTAAADIAAEYGISEQVLLARFAKACGCQPGDWAAKAAANATSQQRQLADAAAAEAAAIEREMIERKAIAEFFATRAHGLGVGVTNAANAYLRAVR